MRRTLGGLFGGKSRSSRPASWDSGLGTPHDIEIVFQLSEPSSVFPYTLAMNFAAAVPYEVVEKEGQRFGEHPVGAGPFRLTQWTRGRSLDLARITPDPPHP